MSLLSAILYVMTYAPSIENYTPVCDRDITNLSLDTKIEIAIGCSTVNKRRAYSESTLLAIYETP